MADNYLQQLTAMSTWSIYITLDWIAIDLLYFDVRVSVEAKLMDDSLLGVGSRKILDKIKLDWTTP